MSTCSSESDSNPKQRIVLLPDCSIIKQTLHTRVPEQWKTIAISGPPTAYPFREDEGEPCKWCKKIRYLEPVFIGEGSPDMDYNVNRDVWRSLCRKCEKMFLEAKNKQKGD